MKILEVRRHTMRVKQGKHLSQDGVTLARRVGGEIGPFARVVTSTVPRAFETAIAMGFAVDEELDELSTMPDAVEDEYDWQSGFEAAAQAVAQDGAAAKFARSQAKLWKSIAQSVPDGGAALAITHGGIVELGAAGCLPEFDFRRWGESCSYCEGVRLSFDGQRFVAAQLLRVDKPRADYRVMMDD